MTTVTLKLVSTVTQDNTTDAAIATALNASTTITTVYGVGAIPISNSSARVFVIYS